jgi:GT2 family glycosyltransferase
MTDDAIVVPGAIMHAYCHFEARLKVGEKLGALAFYNNDWPVRKKYVGDITSNGVPIAHYGLFLTQALQDVGYLDEDYYFYSVDDDLSFKLWHKGWKVESHKSFICHCAHANFRSRLLNTEKALEDKKRFYSKWSGVLLDLRQDLKNECKELEISENAKVGRKFLVPYSFSLAQELLLALMRFDKKFLARVKRGVWKYLKTGSL